jgi:Na+/H+-dicarboxylate symporter
MIFAKEMKSYKIFKANAQPILAFSTSSRHYFLLMECVTELLNDEFPVHVTIGCLLNMDGTWYIRAVAAVLCTSCASLSF